MLPIHLISMPKTKIVSFYNEPWEQKYLAEKLPEYEWIFYAGSMQDNPDPRDAEAEILSVFVKSHIGAPELDRFPNLKFIATRSTGFDHIELSETAKRGITVSNVPFYGENTVAEFAFALLLMLSRMTYEGHDRVIKTGSFSPQGLRGFDLKGKTFGVVGTGHIGRHVIRMAKGFEMNIIAFDVKRDDAYAKEAGISYVSFDELLAQSDIITLHAPYNPHTHHLINRGNVEKIKKGAYIINTARGGLVETDALVYGLEKGIIAGAGLDVLEEEGYLLDETALLNDPHPNVESLKTMLENHYLIDHPRVIITPHMAFNTKEALQRILDTTAENINAFNAGAPANVVKPAA
ncbi:MAG: hydroxyacid dehydrogenase [Parcubacteria group bacterium]|nr:hydroxyacid dehydrogenase [Parcubacteria group bacterium]